MGCLGSKNEDTHNGLKFILGKWMTPDELKPLDTEDLEREAFLERAPERVGDSKSAMESKNNDELTEAFGPYFWLLEQHYATPQDLKDMSFADIRAMAVEKGEVDGSKETYEVMKELAAKGSILNLTAFEEKTLKNAAVFGFFVASNDGSGDDDLRALLKKEIGALTKEGEEGLADASDEDLYLAAVAIGAIRGLCTVPEDKLKEMERDKQRMALVPLAMKADDAGIAKAMEYKDKNAYDLALSIPNTKTSLALKAMTEAYHPETEEEKKKKEEYKAKKAAEGEGKEETKEEKKEE